MGFKRSIYFVFTLMLVFASTSNAKLLSDFVDDFEDGNISSHPVWNISVGESNVSVVVPPRVSSDKIGLVRNAGRYSLVVKGNGDNGKTVAALETAKTISDKGFTHLRVMTFNGVGSKGEYTLVINGTYSCSVFFSWLGWRQAVLPLSRFKDSNGDSFVGQVDSFGVNVDSLDDSGFVNLALDNVELLRVESF